MSNILDVIKEQIDNNSVILYMKGTKHFLVVFFLLG